MKRAQRANERNPMPKKKASPTAAPIVTLAFSDAAAMKQEERITRFASESRTAQAAFAAMGKLFRLIESNIKKTQTIYGVLQAAGVKRHTISNASYGAKAYDLVLADHLTEAEFDTLTYQDCVAISRVMSGSSKKRLTAAEVAAAIKTGEDFAPEFNSLYEDGLTAAEKAKAEKDAKAAKEKAEAEAKAKAEKDAADLEAAKAEAEQLRKQLSEAAAKSNPAPAGEDADPPQESDEDADEDAAPQGEDEDADEDEPAAPEPAQSTAPEPPALVAADVLALLDEVELAISELSEADQSIVTARIIELANKVSTITPHPDGLKANAPAKGKGKKVAAV